MTIIKSYKSTKSLPKSISFDKEIRVFTRAGTKTGSLYTVKNSDMVVKVYNDFINDEVVYTFFANLASFDAFQRDNNNPHNVRKTKMKEWSKNIKLS